MSLSSSKVISPSLSLNLFKETYQLTKFKIYLYIIKKKLTEINFQLTKIQRLANPTPLLKKNSDIYFGKKYTHKV